MFDYTVATTKSFEQAVNDLEAALQQHKFGVMCLIDVQERLKEKGLQLDQQLKIFEVCNPPKAKQALETNPRVGYFLPCKIIVYVNEGQTYIGTVKPTAFMNVLEDPKLLELGEDVENTLIKIVDEAK